MGFLDNTGLTRFLNDIKSKFTAPKSIAYVESTTAKTNHATGDHFMIGEQLKRATSAIATGETIGTSNSADDTVQGQIDTLRDSVGSLNYGYDSAQDKYYYQFFYNTAHTIGFQILLYPSGKIGINRKVGGAWLGETTIVD